jgi:hypothetical protein
MLSSTPIQAATAQLPNGTRFCWICRSFRKIDKRFEKIRDFGEENGFVEGQNVAIKCRRDEAQYERLPAFAAELVSRHVAVWSLGRPSVLRRKARVIPSNVGRS